MEANSLGIREWRLEPANGEYIISTAVENLDIDWVNSSFDSEEMFWAKSLPREHISIMLSQSLNLGLYKVLPGIPNERTDGSPSSPRTPSPTMEAEPKEQLQQVGMARFITDYITFAYLTDVYLEKDHRGLGLGKWLIKCCQEIMEGIPALRRGMLLTSPEVGKRFYSRELGFYDVNEERQHMICMTRRAYNLKE